MKYNYNNSTDFKEILTVCEVEFFYFAKRIIKKVFPAISSN